MHADQPSLWNVVGAARLRKTYRARRLNSELLTAIDNRNLAAAARLLEQGASADATCRPTRCTAAHVAALTGQAELLAMLLAAGARPTAPDRHARLPLHLAAWAGRTECVAALLRAWPESAHVATGGREEKPTPVPAGDADSDSHRHDVLRRMLPAGTVPGRSPLHLASLSGSADCVRLLLQCGAETDVEDADGLTALDVAGEALDGRPDQAARVCAVLEALLGAGAVPGSGSRTSALHTAVRLRAVDAVRLLSAAGASVRRLDASGATPLHVAVSSRHVDALKLLLDSVDQQPLDAVDAQGLTVLHAAVLGRWTEGVATLLEADAEVTRLAPGGNTALHLAAGSGDADVLMELLNLDEIETVLDMKNDIGETPLFNAVTGGSVECVAALLEAGADYRVTMPSNLTILHRTVEMEQVSILQLLLQKEQEFPSRRKRKLMNERDQSAVSGATPLHLAALSGNALLVRLLLESGCDILDKTTENVHRESTALHLAASRDNAEVADILLEYNQDFLEETNMDKKTALHIAAENGSRETMALLLTRGADLTSAFLDSEGEKHSAMELLIHNIPRPVSFLEEVLDSHITINDKSINDYNCVVDVDYRMLMPRRKDGNQMRVLQALLKTGNQYGQENLLLHPLIESFLYVKWTKLNAFFYFILAIYTVFLISFSLLVTILYYLHDSDIDIPDGLSPGATRIIVWITLAIFFLQELMYALQVPLFYVLDPESWIKWTCFVLAALVTTIDDADVEEDAEWARHVTTVAVLLAWVEFMFLLSRSPSWGYYVLMFSKVAANVLKVLLTFVILLIGFAFSFMVQFRAESPFDSPWDALMKTIVIMTGELDYADMFDADGQPASQAMGRIMFLVFVILVTIVLMNLLVGLAVSDITALETEGRLQRLRKQLDYVTMMELFVYNEKVIKCLPRNLQDKIEKKRQIEPKISIFPGRPRKSILKIIPSDVKDAIVNKAVKNNEMESNFTLANIYDKLCKLSHAIEERGNQVTLAQPESKDTHWNTPILLRKVLEQLSAFNQERLSVVNNEQSSGSIARTVASLQEQLELLRQSVARVTEPEVVVNIPA